MAGCCHHDHHDAAQAQPGAAWRRALWVALALNAGMFLVEILGGVASGSSALMADSLDFLGDAGNYALSLGVAGMPLVWRARAAWLKGATMLLVALAVTGGTLWHLAAGTLPSAEAMGVIGVMALAANVACLLVLRRWRGGDANMRSVWICSRNDAIGNVAVMAAALGVFGTGTAWPDLIVAVIMAGLGVAGGWQILRQATRELQVGRAEQAIAATARAGT